MDDRQLALSLVLVAMVFSVALELRSEDFRRVLETPRAIVAGLIPQFLLLPVASWLATLVLDLAGRHRGGDVVGCRLPRWLAVERRHSLRRW
jgi:predicted Na+-dependent transporter